MRPMATSITIVSGKSRVEMAHEYEGIWVGVLDQPEVSDYTLDVEYDGGNVIAYDDPYRYLPTLGEMDQHLVSEGRHENLWTVLGRSRAPLRHASRRGRRHLVRGLGAEREGSPGHR